MMSDRFSAQLRQHLLDTANERPAEGSLATIVGNVARTPQRRPLVLGLPRLQGRIGQLPAAVRLALLALALVLAAVAGAILAGGGAPSGIVLPPTERPSPTAQRPTPTATSVATTLRPTACVDLSEGGAYTAPTDTMSLTATIPRTPLLAWQGSFNEFNLFAVCEEVAPMAIFAMDTGALYETSCMPNTGSFGTFAKAVARLDTPQGPDISRRVNLTIDGHRAARYDIVDLTSCPDGFGLWHGTALGTGETGSVFVIEVDGGLVSIELNRDGSQTAAELQEAYGIVASLHFAR
jgi:hypothetical protein